jgi:metal-responsive CopG/Arc/MetJ family transcriptional regulator
MTKVSIDSNLYERAKQAAEKAGYSSVEELIATAIETELKRIGEADAEKLVADQLRGLGYIE